MDSMNNEAPAERKIPKVILGTVALILVASLFWLYFFGLKSGQQENVLLEHPVRELLKHNESYREGLELAQAGRREEAIGKYKEALPKALDLIEEAQIRFDIATTYRILGDYVRAVALFKEIVSNESFPQMHRAYAAMEIARILPDFGQFGHEHGSLHDSHSENVSELSLVAQEVFKDEPYKSILNEAGGDERLALRRINEFASGIYPLSVTEMGIAHWYLEEMAEGRAVVGSELGESYAKIVRERVINAERDIADRIQAEFEVPYMPPALLDIGFAYEMLAERGVGSLADAEQAYRKAVTLHDILPGLQNTASHLYAKIQLAHFLARVHGAERAEDVANLLSDFYVGNESIPETMKNILRDKKGKPNSDHVEEARRAVYEAAPNFKEYLLYLGWEESDFYR